MAGSSPRMRGTHYALKDSRQYPGIIPAYAGNTLTAPYAYIECRDHPRVCGEHFSSELITIMSMGSSPRMRGTLKQHWRNHNNGGIIPAYAGNTHYGHHRTIHLGDHPRVCGEHTGWNSVGLL